MLACKWLKNLSGITVMNLPVQKNVKIKLRAVFHHMLHPPLATTIFCMQEFTFASAFLPSCSYISSTHTHLCSFLQSMVRFSCLNKTTVKIYWCTCGCVDVTFRMKIPSILSVYDKFCKRTCHESISSPGKEQKAA